MERHRPEPKCFFGLCHVLISCKWVAVLDLILTTAVALIFLDLAVNNCFWIPPALCMLAVVFMIILFIYGLFKENDNFMIPLIVAKVLLSLMVSISLIIAWMLFLLSLFSIITYQSPIDGLSIRQFFVVVILQLTPLLIVCLRILHLYSEAYKYIKKENDFKHVSSGYLVSSNCFRITHRPTVL